MSIAAAGRSAKGPRTRSQKRIAYSVKCASLRIRVCPRSIEGLEIPGKSQARVGSIKRAVFTAENAEVEKTKIKAPQRTTGPHAARTLGLISSRSTRPLIYRFSHSCEATPANIEPTRGNHQGLI